MAITRAATIVSTTSSAVAGVAGFEGLEARFLTGKENETQAWCQPGSLQLRDMPSNTSASERRAQGCAVFEGMTLTGPRQVQTRSKHCYVLGSCEHFFMAVPERLSACSRISGSKLRTVPSPPPTMARTGVPGRREHTCREDSGPDSTMIVVPRIFIDNLGTVIGLRA